MKTQTRRKSPRWDGSMVELKKAPSETICVLALPGESCPVVPAKIWASKWCTLLSRVIMKHCHYTNPGTERCDSKIGTFCLWPRWVAAHPLEPITITIIMHRHYTWPNTGWGQSPLMQPVCFNITKDTCGVKDVPFVYSKMGHFFNLTIWS